MVMEEGVGQRVTTVGWRGGRDVEGEGKPIATCKRVMGKIGGETWKEGEESRL